MEKISIIIPVYNTENYIEKCIDSIIKQTYSNIEIFLINDGSTDNSLNICKKYEIIDKRINVIDIKNKGVSNARNIGLNLCKGNYITFIDSDDFVEKDYIKTMYNKIKENNVDVVISNPIKFINNERINEKNKIVDELILENDNIIKTLLNDEYYYSVCWGKLYSKKVIKKVSFDTNLRIAEDLDFLLNVFNKSSKILLIKEQYYCCNIRKGSTIRSGYNEKWNDEVKLCYQIIKKYENTKMEKYAAKRYIRICMDIIWSLHPPFAEKNKIKRKMKKFFLKYITNKECRFKSKIKFILSFFI